MLAPEEKAFITSSGPMGIQRPGNKSSLHSVRNPRVQNSGTQPGTDRGSESFLFTMEDGCGQDRLQSFLKDPLGRAAAKFHGVTQTSGEVHHLQIKERLSGLESVKHASTGNLGHDIVLAIHPCNKL